MASARERRQARRAHLQWDAATHSVHATTAAPAAANIAALVPTASGAPTSPAAHTSTPPDPNAACVAELNTCASSWKKSGKPARLRRALRRAHLQWDKSGGDQQISDSHPDGQLAAPPAELAPARRRGISFLEEADVSDEVELQHSPISHPLKVVIRNTFLDVADPAQDQAVQRQRRRSAPFVLTASGGDVTPVCPESDDGEGTGRRKTCPFPLKVKLCEEREPWFVVRNTFIDLPEPKDDSQLLWLTRSVPAALGCSSLTLGTYHEETVDDEFDCASHCSADTWDAWEPLPYMARISSLRSWVTGSDGSEKCDEHMSLCSTDASEPEEEPQLCISNSFLDIHVPRFEAPRRKSVV